MPGFRAQRTSLASLCFLGALVSFAGCTKTPDRTITVSMPAQSSAQANHLTHTKQSVSAPATYYGFSCFAINVTGDGITRDDSVKSYCGSGGASIGLIGGLAPFSGGSISLSVPQGFGRSVQLIGFMTPDGTCPALSQLGAYTKTAGNWQAFLLGQTTADTVIDEAVTIQAVYTQASAQPALTDCAAAPSASTSLSTVTAGTGPLSSGSSESVTLTAVDPSDNPMTTGGLNVAFTYSDGTSTGTFGATVDNGNGTYTASFTGVLAGTISTIHATIGGASVTSALPAFKVIPGPYSLITSAVTLASPTVKSTYIDSLTFTTRDAAGNPLPTGGLSVLISASGGTSTGSIGSVTDNSDGTYSANFTGLVVGTPTNIQAKISGVPVSSALPALTVVAGDPSATTSVITVASGTVLSGSLDTLTLHLKDVNGNALTNGASATVGFGFTGGSSTGSITGATDQTDGTFTASFTGTLAGSPTSISATLNGSSVSTASPTITVLPGSPSTATSTYSVNSATDPSGTPDQVTLVTKDAAGNALTLGGATITFVNSGGSSTGSFGSTTDLGNGTYTANFTGNVAGSPTTIKAYIGGVNVTTAPPNITVNPGVISSTTSTVTVASPTDTLGATDLVTLTAKDAAGNAISTGGATLGWGYSGGTSTGSFSSMTDHTNGTYTAIFTGAATGTPTSITATIGGASVLTTLPNITVVTPAVLTPSPGGSSGTYSFGYVPLTLLKGANYTIKNTGGSTTGPLSFTGISTPFGLSSDSCTSTTLAPGATCDIQIGFTPSSLGHYSMSALIVFNNGATATSQPISASGYGVANNSTQNYLYVALSNPSSNVAVHQIDTTTGALATASTYSTASSLTPASIVVAPSGGNVYVSGSGTSVQVANFTVTPSSGALTAPGSQGTACDNPGNFSIDASTAYGFYICSQTGTVKIMETSISSGAGALTAIGTASITGVSASGNTVADPTGRFQYFASITGSPSGILLFMNNGSGILTSSSSSGSAPLGYSGLAMEPSGRFLYAIRHAQGQIEKFQIDPNNGTLSSVTNYGAPSAHDQLTLAASYTGWTFLYSSGPGGIQAYWLNGINGNLAVEGSPLSVHSSDAVTITADPTGQFIYAADAVTSAVYPYQIQTGGSPGILSALGGTKFYTFAPVAIASGYSP